MASRGDLISASLADIDEARVLGAEVYYPHTVGVIAAGDPFCMRLSVRTFGPITVGMLQYDAPVRITTGPLEDGYQINVPTAGPIQMAFGADRMVATPSLAAVHSPELPTSIVGLGSQSMMGVKIARAAMDRALERLLGHRLVAPLTLHQSLVLDHGPGVDLWRVLSLLGDQLRDVDAARSEDDVGASLFDFSPFAESLAQSVITGLLYAQPHNYTDELSRPATMGGPAAIRAAITYIEERAGEPIAVSDIAEHVGLGVRSLQQGFGKHVESTPMAYLRHVRLRGTHQALVEGDPSTTSVATIASGWGFFHLGRFAGQYRDAFGEAPSDTLRKSSG